MSGSPSVAVVVPTRDRPDAARACLAALARQTVRPEMVVLVDDASIDGGAVAAVATEAALPVTLVRGEGHGPAAARNLGVQTATSELVLLTDDDCRPEPGWVAGLVAALADGATVAAGPTLTAPRSPAVDLAAQTVTNHLVRTSLDADGATVAFAPTSNLGARRAQLMASPFDESYPLAAGEDREWCDRVGRDGQTIRWCEGAVVRHHPGLDLGRFWRQQERYGRGAERYRSGRPPGAARPGWPWYAALVRQGFAEGVAVGALVLVAQAATVVGYGRERLRRG